MFYTADELNAVIAQGGRVIARNADVPRRGQPNNRQEVEVTQAFDGRTGDLRVTARGFSGRFRAEILEVVRASGEFVGRDDQ